MSIRVLDELPEKRNVDNRQEKLNRDIREIIDEKIELAEILDTGYPDSSLRCHISKAFRIVVRQISSELEQKTGRSCYLGDSYLHVQSQKDEKGIRHWYVTFDGDAFYAQIDALTLF